MGEVAVAVALVAPVVVVVLAGEVTAPVLAPIEKVPVCAIILLIFPMSTASRVYPALRTGNGLSIPGLKKGRRAICIHPTGTTGKVRVN
jgi:hypothetical protein